MNTNIVVTAARTNITTSIITTTKVMNIIITSAL